MSHIQNQSKGMSATGRQSILLKKTIDLLRAKGIMHRFEIMDSLGLTIQAMNSFNGYLEFALSDIATYNKQSKEWTLNPNAEIIAQRTPNLTVQGETPKSLEEAMHDK